MKDYLRKMEAIVRKDCNSCISSRANIELYSCTSLNGNVEARFIVSKKMTEDLWLYEVIYSINFLEYRVFMYKLVKTFDV